MKISIITVNYNGGRTLKRTIESVLNQKHKEVEYIIIDGKSNDNSLDIIKEYEKKFINKGYEYKYISEKDNGIYNAMNKGIKMSTGDVIGIINSDDWYEEDTLKKVNYEFEKDTELKMVYGVLRTVKGKQFYRILGDYNSFGVGQHPTVFLKREVYDKYVFDEKYKIVADTDLLLKLKKDKIKVKFIEEILSNFSLSGVSSTDILAVKWELIEMEYSHGKISRIKKIKKYLKLIRKNFKYFLKKLFKKGK